MRTHLLRLLALPLLVACWDKGDDDDDDDGGDDTAVVDTDTGENADMDTDADTGADTNADAGADTGADTDLPPVIEDVEVGFVAIDSWVLEFRVHSAHGDSLEGGVLHLGLEEEGDDEQVFALDIGSASARLVDGAIVFAIDGVDRSKHYDYEIQLVAPGSSARSDVWAGRVEAATR